MQREIWSSITLSMDWIKNLGHVQVAESGELQMAAP